MARFLLIGCLVFTLFACASTPEPEPAPRPTPPVAEPAPPPPEPVYEPPPVSELPKTASSLPALGLSGLAALAGAGALRWVRIRIR
jgi:LPXTG-motif cell wall-anchored protein